jgi:SAM-dependent methyltransferase
MELTISSKAELLAEINAQVPKGIDWRGGALRYVQAEIDKHGRDCYLRYLLAKPFQLVPPGSDGGPALVENVAYMSNFLNTAALLNLPGGSKILDVACGSGWVASHFARMGYDSYGFDICEDMVELTIRRFVEDPLIPNSNVSLSDRFFTLDIEREAIPQRLHGTFDAIVLESCMHHFLDPITAMEQLALALKDDGIVVIIEGEARQGPIKPEYLAVMREFDTLERPYTRSEFERILDMVGLKHREFLGRNSGWISPRDPRSRLLSEIVAGDADALNFAICAKSEAPLVRIFPFRQTEAAESQPAPVRPPTLPLLQSATARPQVMEQVKAVLRSSKTLRGIVRGIRNRFSRDTLK